MADDLASQIDRLRRQISKLQDNLFSGVVTVESPDGGRVTYHTYAEKRQALSLANQVLNGLLAQQGGSTPPRRTRQVVMMGRSGW